MIEAEFAVMTSDAGVTAKVGEAASDQRVVRTRAERTQREGVGADRAARRGRRAERSGQERGGIAVDEPGGRLGEARHRRAVDLGLAGVRLDGERSRGDGESRRRGGQRQGVVRPRAQANPA